MALSFNPSRYASRTVGFSYDSSHARTASEENVYWGSRLVAKRVGVGAMGHFITDRLHSKGDGSAFYPYGESKTGAPGDDREQFATYTRDQNSGLDYADQRWYSSRLGRFASSDPFMGSAFIADPNSANRYSYVRNNPNNKVDPSGLYDQDPLDPTNCFLNPQACWNPWPGVIVFPGGGETSWVQVDNGSTLWAQYGDEVAWNTVNWSALLQFSAAASIPFPQVEIGPLPIPWHKFYEWATAIGRRFPALIALELSVSRISSGHLPPDPSKCPKGASFYDPTKPPHPGWTWDGGGGNVAPGQVGGAWRNGAMKLRPDLHHNFPKGPHWEYTDPLGKKWECTRTGDIFEEGVSWWEM